MTKFVTATDALVLSPIEWPDAPDKLQDVFDDFARTVVGLRDNRLVGVWDERRLIVAHARSPATEFFATPVLRDGWTLPTFVPAEWGGHVTLELIAAYFSSEWLLWGREPSWGARLLFRDDPVIVEDGLLQGVELPATFPLVDPLRDTLAPDEEGILPLAPELDGRWAGLLTPWENTDAFLGGSRPGSAWLDRRMAKAVAPSDRQWWEIRGLREADDALRYGPEMWAPRAITLYLGWHAYAVGAAGDVGRCQACGRPTTRDRRYCADSACSRARAAERQRRHRAGSLAK